MAFFDLACTNDFAPLCDCELACINEAILGFPSAPCFAACADARPDCSYCPAVHERFTLCNLHCTDALARSPCSDERDECIALGNPDCETTFISCSAGADKGLAHCAAGCGTDFAHATGNCLTLEAQCNASACEADGNSFSAKMAACATTYATSYATALAASYTAQNGCDIPLIDCSAGCDAAYSTALADCGALSGGAFADCTAAAIAALFHCTDECGKASATCTATVVAALAVAVAAANTVRRVCEVEAEAFQRQRDDRLGEFRDHPRHKAGVQGSAYASCTVQVETVYITATGSADATRIGCKAGCDRFITGGGDAINRCKASCDIRYELGQLSAASALIRALHDCCKVNAPHDGFADCERDCIIAKAGCLTDQTISDLVNDPDNPFTRDCEAEYATCRGVCWDQYQNRYDFAVSSGASLRDIERSCEDCGSATLRRLSDVSPYPL